MQRRPALASRWERRRDQAGAAAVEFALIMVPFLTLVFGVIQYGFYFYSAQTGSSTAGAAVRQLSVGNCQDPVALKSFISSKLGSASAGGLVIDGVVYKNTDGTTATGSTVNVGGTTQLTFHFSSVNLHFPFVPFLSDATVRRSVTARVEDDTDEGCGS